MTRLEEIEEKINALVLERVNINVQAGVRLDEINLELRRLRALKQTREKAHRAHFMFEYMSKCKRQEIADGYWPVLAADEAALGRSMTDAERREHFVSHLEKLGIDPGKIKKK